MHTTYLIGFKVRPGQRDRFLELLNALLDAMRHENTFVNATLHRDGDNENHFLLHETWSDHQDVLDVQIRRPYRQAWHDALPDLLDAPRDISVWHPMRTDHAARDYHPPTNA
ncbi:putative quinol monooxygenase [Rhizobium nepotum]|uniref:putative quinol monooxygenase n=1 Tax=Rhizobium nepotum TaxID=1035271 RepID=UPI00336AA7AC